MVDLWTEFWLSARIICQHGNYHGLLSLRFSIKFKVQWIGKNHGRLWKANVKCINALSWRVVIQVRDVLKWIDIIKKGINKNVSNHRTKREIIWPKTNCYKERILRSKQYRILTIWSVKFLMDIVKKYWSAWWGRSTRTNQYTRVHR
jgi:hypothetical protein